MNHSDDDDLVDNRSNETRGRRVRFFIDPSLSDEEIATRIIEMVEQRVGQPDQQPVAKESG